jgi:hypothetical protein
MQVKGVWKGVWECWRCFVLEWMNSQDLEIPTKKDGLKKTFIWNLHGVKEFISYTNIVICIGPNRFLETWPPIYRGQERPVRDRLRVRQVDHYVYSRYTSYLIDPYLRVHPTPYSPDPKSFILDICRVNSRHLVSPLIPPWLDKMKIRCDMSLSTITTPSNQEWFPPLSQGAILVWSTSHKIKRNN